MRLRYFFIALLPLALITSCMFKKPKENKPVEQIPAPAAEPTRAPQESQPLQTLPDSSFIRYSNLTVILGRPTANSITLNLLSDVEQIQTILYGTASNKSANQISVSLKARQPQNVELVDLEPNTAYYYVIVNADTASDEHIFHTARPAGSTFTFTMDADPHNRDPRFNGELYAATLNNARSDHPDFHINLGDTFMTEKFKIQSYEEAESTFTDMRLYFGILNADAPLFLVNGNHEGELGWLLTRGRDKELPVWSTQLRQLYYPNPTSNDFYSGGTSIDPNLGGVRDSYYSWTWGDALFVVLDPFWYTTDRPKPEAQQNNWYWTLGREQYDWLKSILEGSDSKYKFIFIHHLVGGAELDGVARGGVEFANLYEWGGNNADGSYGFDQQRPGWGKPIHQLLITNHVSAVFHGHDHVFVKQDLDGIVYQELPQPSNDQPDNTNLAAQYGYVNGDVVAGSGHLRVTVTPEQVTIDFIRADLDRPGEVAFTYIIEPSK